MWRAPRPFVVFALVIDCAAVAAIVLTTPMFEIDGHAAWWFAVLAGLSALHLEANRRIERLRELATEGVPYVDLKSIWTFAGLVLLPPPLVAALIVLTYTHSWLRLGGRILPHRWIYSAATVVLGSAAGGAILAAVFPATYPGLPAGWAGIAAVAAAAVARWLVNSLLLTVAMPLMTPGTTWLQALRNVFGTPSDDLVEFASLSLGAGVALILATDAPWLLVLVVPVMAIHRGLMLRQFEYSAQRDPVSGLFNAGFWHELAGKQLERAQRLGSGAGLLLVHVDELDAATLPAGPKAGDLVLRGIADVLRRQAGEEDLLGRLGGDEFVVLLPDVAATADLADVAHRVRGAVRELEIEVDGPDGPLTLRGLTVSIGGALYPDGGATLDELMLTVDNAMFAAKTYVRDQVRLVETRHPRRGAAAV